MKISIIFCHYKNGKMSAYTVSQLLKYKGDNDIEILISDNSRDNSINYLEPFKEFIKIIPYPKNVIQSHGCGYDLLMNHVTNDYVIPIESDSFPTKENWIEYYLPIIKEGYSIAGSIMTLSGGEYIHPAGSIIKKSDWEEAKKYCESIPYHYLPNAAIIEDFPNHLMVHNDIWDFFLMRPASFVELPVKCLSFSKGDWLAKESFYKPVVGPYHNGMGMFKETFKTYSKRNMNTEPAGILLDGKDRTIFRMGYEPGQWLSYYLKASEKKIAQIPTKVKWLPNRENQQQEYTIMDNGFKHLWAGSSFLDMKGTDNNDIYEFKIKQINDLYDSLPSEQKTSL